MQLPLSRLGVGIFILAWWTPIGTSQDIFVPPTANQSASFSLSSNSLLNRSLSGDLGGDGLSDIVWGNGSEIAVWYSPSDYEAPFHYDVGAYTDFALSPMPSDPSVASVLVQYSWGLKRYRLSFALDDLVSEAVYSGSGYDDGVKLIAANLDGQGGEETVQVLSDLMSVRVRFGFHAGASIVQFQTSSTILDIGPLQWVSGGDKEIACLTTAGVEVFDSSGILVDSVPSPLAVVKGQLSVVKHQGLGYSRLAVAYTMDTSTPLDPADYYLMILDGTAPPELGFLGEGDYVAMTTGTVDNDLRDDLIIRLEGSPDVHYSLNQYTSHGTDPTFDLTAATTFATGLAASSIAPVALEDLDEDGDCDIVVVSDGGAGSMDVNWYENANAGAGWRMPEGVAPDDMVNVVGGVRQLNYHCSPPAVFDFVPTHVRVVIYGQNKITNIVPGTPIYETNHALPTAPAIWDSEEFLLVSLGPDDPEIDRYYILCYCIKILPNGDRVRGPGRVSIIEFQPDDPSPQGTLLPFGSGYLGEDPGAYLMDNPPDDPPGTGSGPGIPCSGDEPEDGG